MDSYKCVFVGNACVGKTHMVYQLMGQQPPGASYVTTLGVQVHSYGMDGVPVIYNIWDTAGNPTFGGRRNGYFAGGDIFIVFAGGLARLYPCAKYRTRCSGPCSKQSIYFPYKWVVDGPLLPW